MTYTVSGGSLNATQTKPLALWWLFERVSNAPHSVTVVGLPIFTLSTGLRGTRPDTHGCTARSAGAGKYKARIQPDTIMTCSYWRRFNISAPRCSCVCQHRAGDVLVTSHGSANRTLGVKSFHIISYHIISYQKFIVRPLLREPRPQVHYKSQPNAKTPKKNTKINKCQKLD